MSLTPKQARFVQEYLLDLNATQAAIRAGYSAKTAGTIGNENLLKPEIAAAVAAAQAERAKRVEVSQDYVLASILNAVERCKQAEPVVDRQGNPVLVETPGGDLAPAYTFNAMGVFRGAELLGKHLGMFRDKVEVTGANGGPIQSEDVTKRDAEEFARRVVRLAAAGGAGAGDGGADGGDAG